ncbi:hypothetical protein NDU88_001469 [Pleurodeles waltl]|uniref:Uncharacterized protein n=1 Tax=Pleurodeles waltl TaxID=8319 RepID=A0AAV7USW8_PLEWA|nr:hypothetical protein NDU88_001469 [Pleurodeles waltl]
MRSSRVAFESFFILHATNNKAHEEPARTQPGRDFALRSFPPRAAPRRHDHPRSGLAVTRGGGLPLRGSSSLVASSGLAERKLDNGVFLLGCLARRRVVFCSFADGLMGHWAGPVFVSKWLGQLQAAEARVLDSGLLFCADNVTVKLVLWPWGAGRPSCFGSGWGGCFSVFSSELEGPSQEEQKGKYISRELLPPPVKHVKVNMDFPEDEVPDTPSGSLLCQFQISVPVDGRTSLAEDAVIRDAVDKKADMSLKKVCSGTHLALRAGIYGTDVAQSLLLDLKA